MKMTAQSAAMRRLRRDLEARRMRGALAPAGAISKKPSPPPLCSAPTTTSPPAPAGMTSSSVSFIKGAHVRVRTAVGTMRTGKLLVLWLGAVVVSAAEEDGCLGVGYTHYKNPRSSDPFCTARVTKNDVKNMPPPPAAAIDAAASAGGGCSDVTMSHSALPSLLQGKVSPALRPTVAGKKPSLLKKMEGEMRSKSDAILASWR